VPFGVTAGDVYTHLKQRIVTDPDHSPRILPGPPRRPTPIVQVVDKSIARRGIHIVCRPPPGAAIDEAMHWVRSVWPVTIEVDCQLPTSMRHQLASWERGDGSGLHAPAALL